jgi:nucleoside-diphosphate-sugar epimerase
MHIIVIGGTGHIGTYLVPRLVQLGHAVSVVSRGQQKPYQDHPAWRDVNHVSIDRSSAEQAEVFGQSIRSLKPDVVMDMTCYNVKSAHQLVDALRGEIQLFLHCGTVWVCGYPIQAPMTEELPRRPIEVYGINKNLVETYLIDQARRTGFPAAILHPGHIVGPGWAPVGPTACHDLQAFEKLAHGEELCLPNLGLETLHHVHADDVAQSFVKAMHSSHAAVGQSFFIVSEAALTLRGFTEAAASWFGQQAKLRFASIEEWKTTLTPEFVEPALAHLHHSTNCSCLKAQRFIGYQPRYTSLEAVFESVMWMVDHGKINITA